MAIVCKSLLGLVAACFVSNVVFAQTDELVRSAFRKAMNQDKPGALKKLREVLKGDPSAEEAFVLYGKIEYDIWKELLLQKGEIGKIVQTLMQRATSGRIELSRDADTIAPLVADAVGKDYGKSRSAIAKLASNHGEFAVPALLAKLGDHDDDEGQIRATWALREIGQRGTLALIEAMQSTNPTLRRQICAVINLTKDRRAIPALSGLLGDSDAGVVRIAKAALRTLGAAGGGDASELFLTQSQEYLIGLGTQGTDLSDVIWSFAGGKLAYKDCKAGLYSFELAKRSAAMALAANPASDAAKTLIARSYLAQVASIDTGGLQDEMGDVRAGLQIVAMAMGPAVLGSALKDCIRDNQPFVAVAAIVALGKTEDRDSLAGSPLNAALDSGNKMIAYAAALALTEASRNNNVPNSNKVVGVLAQAVAEKNLMRIATVGFSGTSLAAINEISSQRRGMIVEASFKTRIDTIDRVLTGAVKPDVIVINSVLPDGIPLDIIGIFQERDRTKSIKFILAGEDKDGVYEGKVHAVIPADFKSGDLRDLVEAALEDANVEAGRARAAKVAIDASNALHTLAINRVDIGGAVASIAAQLGREDAVAIPAANALGEAASDVDPLVKQLAGDGSVALKTACAVAAGKILGRTRSISAGQFDAMKAVAADASADVGLRTAVATALGKASLSAGQTSDLVNTLAVQAVTGG